LWRYLDTLISLYCAAKVFKYRYFKFDNGESEGLRKLKPRQFIQENYPDSGICTATVKNWIKSGKIKGERTPTGRYLVVIDPEEQTRNEQEVIDLLHILEA
jgi:hypothetical protein